MLKKVISGGQTGADKAGLVAARDSGLKTGGTAPKGYRICDFNGKDSSDTELIFFGLTEHKSYEYPPRTRQNVLDSDATVWFGYDKSPGAKLTIKTATTLNKHHIINPSAENLANWIITNGIEVLNVAGNRFSKENPNIFYTTYQTLMETFKLLKSCQ